MKISIKEIGYEFDYNAFDYNYSWFFKTYTHMPFIVIKNRDGLCVKIFYIHEPLKHWRFDEMLNFVRRDDPETEMLANGFCCLDGSTFLNNLPPLKEELQHNIAKEIYEFIAYRY